MSTGGEGSPPPGAPSGGAGPAARPGGPGLPRIPAVVGPGGVAVHRLDGRPADRHADLRARMRAAGRAVGPDGPIVPRAAPVADLVRRAFDVAVSTVALAVLAVPLALVLLAVRLESPGHPVFRQRRVGRDGHEFDVLKVRTMVQGAETMGAGLSIVRGDARITRLGRLLRRTSIDELPQFVNVLRGEMSIVGPRPTVPVQIERYDERQVERLLVRPGLTGWAQVQGRTTLTWPERIEFDRWYVAHRTLRTDLRILTMTVRVVLGGAGVERDGAAWGEGPPKG